MSRKSSLVASVTPHLADSRTAAVAVMAMPPVSLTGTWTRNGLQVSDARGVSCIDRARHLKRTLGIKAAAAYLRNRGWSVEAASAILARRSGKF